MRLGFEIFRRMEDGTLLWIAYAESLSEAEHKLSSLRRSAPARYFLRDAESGAVTDAELGEHGEPNVGR